MINSRLLFSLALFAVAANLVASESGLCSWYGPGLAGHKTANGEIFDPNGMTAAHKTLPFNTKVKVAAGGKSVEVRINDRGPFISGRILDLAEGAAKQLGIIAKGAARCDVTIIPPKTN